MSISEPYRDYVAEFQSEINRMTNIEKVLHKYGVKVPDMIGLTEELNALCKPVAP